MRSRLLSFLIFIFSLSPFVTLAALTPDSTGTKKTDTLTTKYFFFHQYFLTDSLSPDSSFSSLREIDNLNNYPPLFIGNAGHAAYAAVYHRHFLDQSFSNAFEGYFRRPDNIRFYNTPKPFSVLTYTGGSKRTQYFNILHTQNFGEHFNIKLDLTKRGAIGFYNHLNTNNTFFDFSTNFRSRDQRYNFLGYYYMNKINAQENGGFDDFLSVNNPDLSGTTRLEDADNYVKDQRYYMRHGLRFGKTTRYMKDTTEYKDFSPRVEIAYAFQYAKSYKFYDDNDKPLNIDYYPAFFEDTLNTFDTIQQKKYENEVILSALNGKYAFLGFSGGHQYVHYIQTADADTSFDNYFAGAFLHRYFGKMEWRASGRYFLQGYNEGDINAGTVFKVGNGRRDDPWSVSLDISYELKEPEYYLTRYESNHFVWFNAFDKTERLDFQLSGTVKKFNLMLEYATVKNLVWFDSKALPFQYGDALNIMNFTVDRTFRVANIYLENRATYQTISNRRILPLPQLIARESLYYKNLLFKKALEIRLGATVFYYSEHDAMSYMPVLTQFHLSAEREDEKFGDYPFLSVFLDMKIKRMKVYFMFTHINKGYSGDNYYRVPDYPLPPRAFSFGLRWNLVP